MGSAGYQTSSSSTHETKLSKQQAEILKQREAQYQQYFFPKLVEGLQQATNGTNESNLMQGQSRAIGQQTTGAKQQFSQSMAQRGLAGTGVEAQGLASISNTKSQLLADAYSNVQQANQDRALQYIQIATGMSPTPTTAAPLGQSSSSSGFNVGLIK